MLTVRVGDIFLRGRNRDYFMVGEYVRFLFTSCEESKTNEWAQRTSEFAILHNALTNHEVISIYDILERKNAFLGYKTKKFNGSFDDRQRVANETSFFTKFSFLDRFSASG